MVENSFSKSRVKNVSKLSKFVVFDAFESTVVDKYYTKFGYTYEFIIS